MRVPKYYQVKNEILTLITDLAPGSAMPTERELAERFETSRTTVRQAIAELVEKARGSLGACTKSLCDGIAADLACRARRSFANAKRQAKTVRGDERIAAIDVCRARGLGRVAARL